MATRQSLRKAVSDARYWGQVDALRELCDYFESHERLPALPVSKTDWYQAWVLFYDKFSEKYPDASPRVKDAAWAAYKNAWRFAYKYLERAIPIITENIKDYIDYNDEIPDEDAHWSSNQDFYLTSLPEIEDDDLRRDDYLLALSRMHTKILRKLSELYSK